MSTAVPLSSTERILNYSAGGRQTPTPRQRRRIIHKHHRTQSRLIRSKIDEKLRERFEAQG